MAAADDDLALTYPIPRDMQLPPTPPEDYSDENNKARLQTPPMQTLQQLLTPDNTPPGMVLHPPRPLLSRDPSSSRANSFSTAREQQSREFLSVVDEAGSQVGEDSSSEEEFEVNSKGNAVEKEPWLNIPGAFRSTPSSTDSRNTVISNYRSVSTPSTGSSDSRVRPKQYLDPESSPSTGSSRNIAREKRYRLDTESPLDRERTYVDGSTSCAQSSRSSQDDDEEEEEDDDDDEEEEEEEEEEDEEEDEEEEDDDDEEDEDKEVSSSSQQDGVDGQDSEQYSHYHEAEEDWGNHVSYMSADGENESATGQERSFGSARGSPASSRLSGHGRRVGNNGTHHSKGINNPPYTLLSNKAAEQGLLKRGSNESSRQRSDGTPSPSIAAQKRRQKTTIPNVDGAGDDATPGASEARRLNWLRQHAGTLASPDIPAEFLAAPPRNSNDLVYKHIQQANMDRFDAIKDGKAVEAVVIPSEDARNRHLRHVTKRQSLRSMSDNNSSYVPSNPPKREPTLRHKKPLPQKVSEPGSPESPTTTRSASGSHSLRHEKRPLKGTGRPLQSNESSPAPAHVKQSLSLRQKPAIASQGVPKLRHASLPIHLSPDASQASPTSVDSKDGQRRRAHALRRSSREYRIENNNAKAEKARESIPEPKPEHKDHSTIIETKTFASPHLLGLGAHHRDRSLGTPFSASANSDRTEMEVCEAQNVAFYPHSNESLLVVQHRSKPDRRDRGELEVLSTAVKGGRSTKSKEGTRMPPIRSESPPRSPPAIAVNGKSIHTVESPLTNPREAPMPPVINFIPATPSHEDDEQELAPVGAVEEDDIPSTPQRRGSLAKRARRYSEVVVRPLFGRTLVTRSHNIRPSPTASEKRDERLHPNWVPNSFWQDDDDDDEDDYYDEPEDSFERLPAGGDTSEHPRAKFPRNMSVRMPGFRGSGGFLLGNSLGMDRHGTNKRRPHVAPPSTNGSTQQTSKPAVRRVASLDSMSTRATGDGRIFVIPGTHTRLQYVGFKPIKDKIKKRRQSKEDAARERRRAELKDQIGMRIVHDA